MSNQPGCLSSDAMYVFLDGELSQAEDSTVIEHLDHCPKCRAALEMCAGGQQWLGHVKENLTSGDVSVHAGEVDQEPALANEPFLIADRLSFLAPSDDPRMLGRLGIYEVAGVVGYGAMGGCPQGV